ncbi:MULTISPECIES: hypothetical protein [Corallococcus]|uniref:hypothetical protein n=1 Tax=Corallococcus TaxID=83461 RepID=UPI001F1C98FC|nr:MULTISPECIES: hypothetical protein [Corallococcus]
MDPPAGHAERDHARAQGRGRCGGNVYLAGYSGGGLGGNPNGTPGVDAYLAKYDSAGTLLWTREIGSNSWVWGTGIGVNNTRARIQQLYGEQYGLVLEDLPEGGVVARVELPFVESRHG